MTYRVFGRVDEKGKFQAYNRDAIYQAFAQLKGKRVELSIRPETKQRSNNQNAYYWGVVVKMIADEIGEDTETVHELLKDKFNRSEIIIKGNPETVSKSTTELSTEEFNQYIEKIQIWAANFLGITIPDPNQTEFV
jgi:hypothetical protein